jgi:hypothetical protein
MMMMIMNFLYLLLVVAISEGFSIAPTTTQVHHPQDIHEWFTESLHEAESGEIKISSDDSWIAQQFHIVSPSSLLLPLATLVEPRYHNTNEWMTQAMEFGVVGPTAAQSRGAASGAAGAVVPPNSSFGRSDGFVETIVNAPIPGHITTTTTKKNNNLGRSPGRADWFGDSIFTSLTHTPPIVLGEHEDDATTSSTTKPIAATAVRVVGAPSPQSADWFLQAMYDHWDATVGKQAYW